MQPASIPDPLIAGRTHDTDLVKAVGDDPMSKSYPGAQRESANTYLPSVYSFETVGEWAKFCLPMLDKGQLMFMDMLLCPDTQEDLLGLFRMLCNDDTPTNARAS